MLEEETSENEMYPYFHVPLFCFFKVGECLSGELSITQLVYLIKVRFEFSTRHGCLYFSKFIPEFNRRYTFSGRRVLAVDSKMHMVTSSISRIYRLGLHVLKKNSSFNSSYGR